MSDETLLIWGAGAIGGTVGAYLRDAGRKILFVDTSAEHVAAIQQHGVRITGPIREFAVSAEAVLSTEVRGIYKTCFLCVKAQDTAAATETLAPHLSSDGCVVSLQNGLNEAVIAERVGIERTVGAFVNFGADYISPGVITYGGRGAVVVGELDGVTTGRIREIHALLQLFDDQAVLTANIMGFLWSKLAYGALLFATALTNESIADCLSSAEFRPILVSLAREVVSVAAAENIRLEPFDGFDPNAFRPGADNAAHVSLDSLAAHNRRSAKSHSGIWRDLAVRRRKTEVDAQLGALAAIARNLGVNVPVVRRTIELIHDIEAGSRAQNRSMLYELAAAISSAAETGPNHNGYTMR